MRLTVLTQFPDMFAPVLGRSMLGKAVESGLLAFDIRNIRDYTQDKHKKTDDTPFGGGAGMLMTPQPAFDCLNDADARSKRCIYMSPRGRLLDASLAAELAAEDELLILCGHYEGVDQRIIDRFNMEEVSIGDYILTGGELACMVLIDCVARLVPGVLGNDKSPMDESVYSGLLEYDQYTKPREYDGMRVPDVLFSGDHEAVRLWQWEQSLRITRDRRPDLFEKYMHSHGGFSKKERKIIDSLMQEINK